MNSGEFECFKEPSFKNVGVLVDITNRALARTKAMNSDIMGTIGPNVVLDLLPFIKETEKTAKRLDGLLYDSDELDQWVQPDQFTAEYDDLYISTLKQVELVDRACANWADTKLEIYALCKPPIISELITRLTTSRRQVERVLDSRAENYVRHCFKHGSMRAYAYHWTDTLKSCWPALQKIVPLAMIVDWVRRWWGS